MRRANGRHLAFLQHAKQLGLQFQRHIADFVEKHDALVASAEHAQARASGAGKRPAFVAKELAFRQRGRECRAIDGNKRLVRARAQAVEKSSPNFLAGAGFARDEHRAFDLGGPLGVMGDARHGAVATNDETGWILGREIARADPAIA